MLLMNISSKEGMAGHNTGSCYLGLQYFVSKNILIFTEHSVFANDGLTTWGGKRISYGD